MSEMPESYLIEYTRVGAQVKVSACDPHTGIEATVIVPANLSQKDMADHAIRRLHYVMNKRTKNSSDKL
jgi:hypothetical protein